MIKSIVLAVLAASLMNAPSAQEPQKDPVWFWFATCGGPAMTLEVRFDDRTLHKSSFPLCQATRDSTANQGQAGRVGFTFRPQRKIVWEGYRETNDLTPVGAVIEGNFWQAGADPEDLILGVTFVYGDRVLINTVHIAHPDRREESTVARGLVVRTYPAK